MAAVLKQNFLIGYIRRLANFRRLATAGLLGAWAYLAALHGRYRSTDIGLPPDDSDDSDDSDGYPDGEGSPQTGASPAQESEPWPSVAVVVPARNEEQMLVSTLPLLLAQDYPGPVRLVVVDDASTDATAAVCASLAKAAEAALPLQVVAGSERPPGWAGKTWAVHQGIQEAMTGFSPRYVLLTDADIAHPPGSLRALVRAAHSNRLDSISLMARLSVAGRAERLIVPAFVYFFSQLYPFARVNNPHRRTAAAAGGCILVRRDALEAAGGIEAVRGAVIDDVALAKALKASGAKTWLGLAEDVRSLRPYPHLGDLWEMIARSAYTQLRHSLPLLALTLAALGFVYAGPPTALLTGLAGRDLALAAAGAISWAAMTITYLPMIHYYDLRWPWALTLPISALLYGAMTLDSARRHHYGGVRWKGRRY